MRRAFALALLILLLPPLARGGQPAPPQDFTGVTFAPVTLPPDTPAPKPSPTALSSPESSPKPTRAPTPAPKPSPTERTFYRATVGDAQAYALAQLGATQFACLDEIAIRESHWNPYDLNHSSGAYGIPQAVPGSKMATAGADWRTNPVTQVKWMIHYVDGRYGSACGAWAFWQGHDWY